MCAMISAYIVTVIARGIVIDSDLCVFGGCWDYDRVVARLCLLVLWL